MSRKICKCERPGYQGLNGTWYCDEHYLKIKNWGNSINTQGKKAHQSRMGQDEKA